MSKSDTLRSHVTYTLTALAIGTVLWTHVESASANKAPGTIEPKSKSTRFTVSTKMARRLGLLETEMKVEGDSSYRRKIEKKR